MKNLISTKKENNSVSYKDYTSEYFSGLLKGYLEGGKVNKINIIFSYLGDVRNLRVLDAGCGTGIITAELSKRGANVVSMDFSQNAIKFMHTAIKKEKKSIWILIGDAENLPFKRETFDVVVSNDVIEHIYHPLRFIHEAFRVLNDNGILLVSTPNLWYIYITWSFSKILNPTFCFLRLFFGYSSKNESLNKSKSKNYGYLHVNLFSPLRLFRALTNTGFKVKRMDTFFFKGHSGRMTFLLNQSLLSKPFRQSVIALCHKNGKKLIIKFNRIFRGDKR